MRRWAASAQQQAQDRLGAAGVGILAGDQVEVGVGLDQAHDHVGDLVQVGGQGEPPGARLLAQQLVDPVDQARLEVGSWRVSRRIANSPSSASQRFMPALAMTASRKRVTISTTRSAPPARTSAAIRRERALGQRPDDLDEQLLARADPAVEGDAVDAQLGGERAHVDALARLERAARAAEGVDRRRAPVRTRVGQLALEPGRRARGEPGRGHARTLPQRALGGRASNNVQVAMSSVEQTRAERRELARLAFAELGAATGGIGQLHRAIADRAFRAVGPQARVAHRTHDAIAGGVYAGVRAAALASGASPGPPPRAPAIPARRSARRRAARWPSGR